MKPVTVTVPATTANLGPGFDTLGLALNVVDTYRVDYSDDHQVSFSEISGAELDIDPHDNLLCRAYRAWGEDTQVSLPGARFRLESKIPIGRGLGSSAATIVAGLAAAANASGDKAPRERLLRLAAKMDGHPDNGIAAIMGGMTAAYSAGDSIEALHVASHLAMGVALFVPEMQLLTLEARAALPASVPVRDAVHDLGRLAYLVTALIWGKWDRIGPAMKDKIHHPYRAPLAPASDGVIAAALEAGAYGAAISGGGPSIIALGPFNRIDSVAQAMNLCAEAHGWAGNSIVTSVREHGVQVKEVEE